MVVLDGASLTIDSLAAVAEGRDEVVLALLESLIQVLRAHPCASQLLVAGEKQNDAALRATEVTLDVLRRGGFDPVPPEYSIDRLTCRYWPHACCCDGWLAGCS